MDSQLLCEKFERIGARVKIVPDARVDRVKIDIGRDQKGEYFDLKVRQGNDLKLDAVDVRPHDRHLLLMARDLDPSQRPVGPARRFLCGHDERAWFVAAVPENRAVADVRTAMEALKPFEVHRSQDRARVRFKDRNRRRNAGFVRQGEWFFVPTEPWWHIDPARILRNEPLVRTGGKPHRVEFLYRSGGEAIYVNSQSQTMSEGQYRFLKRENPSRVIGFVPRRQNMQVLVKGRVSHPDHKTIVLRGWHSVHMNTENQSEAMRFVSFID